MSLDSRRISLLRHTFLDYQPTERFLQQPLIIDRAEGVYYWDVDQKRYFDGIGGIFVAILGHGHPRVIEALKQQASKLSFAPPMHGIADVALDFVEKLGAVTPSGLDFVKTYSGGSEAMESALKFTRQYFKQAGCPGKYKFISRYQGYHGGTMGAMAASGTGARKSPFEPQMSGFLKVFPPTHYRDRFASWEECNRFAAEMVEDVIIGEDPTTVAGVILEPIGLTGGVITPTPEYFRLLREICDRHNVVLIFDEIINGFGRTGSMFAAQTFETTPDIICCGKAISNGAIPLAAMIAHERMAKAFEGGPDDSLNFAHGHTYANNPMGCAVGAAVVDELAEKGLPTKARSMGDYLAGKLEALRHLGVIGEVRGRGLLLGADLVTDGDPSRPFPELGSTLKRTALRNGLIMRIDPTWFAVGPALVAGEAEIDELADLIEKSLRDALSELK